MLYVQVTFLYNLNECFSNTHTCHVAICNLISVYCAAMTLRLRKYVDINQADAEVLASLSVVNYWAVRGACMIA